MVVMVRVAVAHRCSVHKESAVSRNLAKYGKR
jgi:hypothetical protein